MLFFQVSVIIGVLRQQTIFNRLLLSCYSNRSVTPSNQPTPSSPQTTVDVTLEPGNSAEFVFAHPCAVQLCVMNVNIVPPHATKHQVTVEVSSTDTQKTSVLNTVLNKFLSVPLTLHGLLRILTHHHKNNIKPVKVKQEVKDIAAMSLDLSKVSSPPSMTLTSSVVKCELPNTDVGPRLTPPPMSQGHMHTMPSPFAPDSMKTLPSPPDIIAQKRKRPVGCDQDDAMLKKPTKLVKICDSVVPSIPVLSPMGGLSNIRHPMRPIGPPSLKPAPIHSSSSPQGGLGIIPCLSPAPRMTRAPNQSGVPGLQTGVPNLQSQVPVLQSGIGMKSDLDHDQSGEGSDNNP